MKKSWGILGIILVAAIVFGAIGWWVYANHRQSSASTALVPITVRLKWLHQSQFAGNYVADQKGYYRDEGLAVTLKSFDLTHYPIDEVVSGNEDFGVAGADELLVAREKGERVKALAVIYQDSPVVAYALASSGITKPTDFIGKKLGMEQVSNVQIGVHAMLAAQGIDYTKSVTEIPIGYDAGPVLSHTVDIGTGYVTNEPIQAEEAGQHVNIIAPYSYGVKTYADVLFTSEDMIAKHPDVVAGFVRATLKGWEYAVTHIDEAANLTLLYKDPNNNALNFAHQKALLTRSIPFIKPNAGREVGSMSFEDWQRTYQLLRDYKLLTKDSDVTQAYTREFLPK